MALWPTRSLRDFCGGFFVVFFFVLEGEEKKVRKTKRDRENKMKEKKMKEKKTLTGSTATHEGVVTEGAPESVSGTMTGPPSRNTATEELAVPRSKPTERGRGGGGGCWSEEEEELALEWEEEEKTATARRRRR